MRGSPNPHGPTSRSAASTYQRRSWSQSSKAGSSAADACGTRTTPWAAPASAAVPSASTPEDRPAQAVTPTTAPSAKVVMPRRPMAVPVRWWVVLWWDAHPGGPVPLAQWRGCSIPLRTREGVPVPDPSTRELDLVLVGATGFTGGLTAEYLAAHAPEGCRWGLAGRSPDRLEAVRDRLAAIAPALSDLPLLTADVTDEGSLADLVRRTRLVVTTVGPYLRYGGAPVAGLAAGGAGLRGPARGAPVLGRAG